MKVKSFFIRLTAIVSILVIFSSCDKENIKDPRDLYIGKYSGIEIYRDYQQDITDTSNTVVYFNKYDNDSIHILELDLPSASQMYYFSIVDGKIENYGDLYYCPLLKIINDSLNVEWTPSSGPREYKYLMRKETN